MAQAHVHYADLHSWYWDPCGPGHHRDRTHNVPITSQALQPLRYPGTALPHNEICPCMKFQVHIFSTLRVMPGQELSGENLQTAITRKLRKSELWVLSTALPHNEIYSYMKFQVHIFSTLRVMPRTRIKRENLQTAITPKLCKSELRLFCTALRLIVI